MSSEGIIDEKSVENFRGLRIFVSDHPSSSLGGTFFVSPFLRGIIRHVLYRISGAKRGQLLEVLDSFQILEKMGFLDLLAKYPSPEIGNPFNWRYRGYSFTNRYLRHIYIASMFKKILGEKLPHNPVIMDIGSSYGIFSSLLKQEIPTSHHVLVDLPGQLILAHYYLGSLFPNAKIADFKDVGSVEKVDRTFVEKYDFVLVPTTMYSKVEGCVDVVTNFVSLAEMAKEWFDGYTQSEPFKKAPYLFMINRYDSFPTYHNNITVMDYPLHMYEKIYMRTWEISKWYYTVRFLFWCRPVRYPSEFFVFIGKKKIL